MPGVGAAGGEAGEVGDDVVGAEAVRVKRRPVLLQATGEAGERLAVGGDRAGRLPLHRAAGQVGLDEGGQEQVGGEGGVHGPSMDALLGPAVKRRQRPGAQGCWGTPEALGGIGNRCRISP